MYNQLRSCGVCCAVLSIWAVLQLGVMGLCFYHETFPFLEEALEYSHPHSHNLDDFVKETKKNYKKIAKNCWLAAAMYCGTLLLSFVCIGVARKKTQKVFSTKDEDLFCSAEAGKFAELGKITKEKAKKKEPSVKPRLEETINLQQEPFEKVIFLGQTYREEWEVPTYPTRE